MKLIRRRVIALAPVAVLCLTFGASTERLSASVVPITLYNTGVDNSGASLPSGAVDPHYSLIMGGTDAYVAFGATVTEQTQLMLPAGWPLSDRYVSSTSAQWIAPTADIVSVTGNATYEYVTTFDLTGMDPSLTSITGKFSVDNTSDGIYLNGHLVPGTTTTDIYDYTYLTSFTITSGFVPGVNTLAFVVNNSPAYTNPGDPNPTGLLVEISGSTDPLDPTPEPAAAWIAGSGLAAMIMLRFWSAFKSAKR